MLAKCDLHQRCLDEQTLGFGSQRALLLRPEALIAASQQCMQFLNLLLEVLAGGFTRQGGWWDVTIQGAAQIIQGRQESTEKIPFRGERPTQTYYC